MAPSWLWMVFTIIAASAQTVRNTTQRALTPTLGTTGATHVRFLFGLPFSLVFLAGVAAATGPLPQVPTIFWAWVTGGAMAQIFATALMLLAMNQRSFVVAISYTKTEPALVALFGLLFLGDVLSLGTLGAIALVSFGVFAISLDPNRKGMSAGPMALGVGSGGLFALSAVGLRGAILALHSPNYMAAATVTLVASLTVQAVPLSLYLVLFRRRLFAAVFAQWRKSMLAGFMGAFASQFWFLGFALTSAAHVRTLALVEVLFAQGVTHYLHKQPMTRHEAVGIVFVVLGVGLLVSAAG